MLLNHLGCGSTCCVFDPRAVALREAYADRSEFDLFDNSRTQIALQLNRNRSRNFNHRIR